MLQRLILVCVLCLAAAGARAQPVDLLLVLAVDASGSIDPDEFQLQREGYAQAVRDPQVIEAIRSGGAQGAIAIAMVEWGAPGGAATVVPWTRVADEASAARLAADILAAPRSIQSYNAIGDAIDHAARLIREAPLPAERRVIDVSGDGPDNRSLRSAPRARDAAVAAGITINALAISGALPGRYGEPLATSYEREVIGGPGSFVMTVPDRRGFARAILAKLIREIAGLPGPRRVALSPPGE